MTPSEKRATRLAYHAHQVQLASIKVKEAKQNLATAERDLENITFHLRMEVERLKKANEVPTWEQFVMAEHET